MVTSTNPESWSRFQDCRSQIKRAGSIQHSKGFSSHAHHKLHVKEESYSKKGFGNGFVSLADRFSGVDETKFLVNTN